MTEIEIDAERKWFLRGVLAALASSGQVVHYDEVRRLARLNQEQLGAFLQSAREDLRDGEPDFCAVVVNDSGWPGTGFGELKDWPAELRAAHRYWQDRRALDNQQFKDKRLSCCSRG